MQEENENAQIPSPIGICRKEIYPDEEMSVQRVADSYLLFYQTEHACRYLLHGSPLLLSAGEMLILQKDMPYWVEPVSDRKAAYILLTLPRTCMNQIEALYPQADFHFLGPDEFYCTVSNLPARQKSDLYSILCQLLLLNKDVSAQVEAERSMLLGLLFLLLHKLRRQKQVICRNSPFVPYQVLIIQKYLMLHYAEPLNLTHLARQFQLSPCYLSRIFRSSIGMGLMDYLSLVRIQAAQVLLETTDKSIAAVAKAVGYPAPSTFRARFERKTGMTPLHYRKLFTAQKGRAVQTSPSKNM